MLWALDSILSTQGIWCLKKGFNVYMCLYSIALFESVFIDWPYATYIFVFHFLFWFCFFFVLHTAFFFSVFNCYPETELSKIPELHIFFNFLLSFMCLFLETVLTGVLKLVAPVWGSWENPSCSERDSWSPSIDVYVYHLSPDRVRLRKERFILAHSSKGRPFWQRRDDDRHDLDLAEPAVRKKRLTYF